MHPFPAAAILVDKCVLIMQMANVKMATLKTKPVNALKRTCKTNGTTKNCEVRYIDGLAAWERERYQS